MTRAMRLAEKGAGWTRPNPLVGAVLVRDGAVIGEGWHDHYGGPHAEAAALASSTADPAGATLYVTLEPCSHTGKTPPCARLLIDKRIANVVVGMTDPNPLVNGKGIAMLREAGIRVETGILEKKVRRQNEPFIKFITAGEPFVVLKTAMSLDGKIATATGESRWITGEVSRLRVHRLRSRYAAVMTGIGTILADDPQLNVRLKGRTHRSPLRIVVDSSLRIPLDARVLREDPQLTILAVTEKASGEKIRDLERLGIQVLVCPEKAGQVDLNYLMKALGTMEIDSLLIESGGALAWSALESGIVDRVTAFIAPKIIGGAGAPTPVGGAGFADLGHVVTLEEMEMRKTGQDIMIEARILKKRCSQES